MEKEELNHNRRETRHHNSLEFMQDTERFQLVDQSCDIAADVAHVEQFRALYAALEQLPPDHKKLVLRVYFFNISIAQVASEEGVWESAIRKRLNRIQKNLKIFLQ